MTGFITIEEQSHEQVDAATRSVTGKLIALLAFLFGDFDAVANLFVGSPVE
jgi:hypothetical protein